MSRTKVMRKLVYAMALLLMAQCDALQGQTSAATESERVITFLSHRTGTNLLYKMKPDGTEITPIFGGPIECVPSFTPGVTLMRVPHWTRQSPDGKYFASWVYEQGEPYAKYQGMIRPMLWVSDIDGKWTRIVNPDCTEEFAWSPDSKRIAFSILSRDHNRGFLKSDEVESTEVGLMGIDGSGLDFVLEQEGLWFVQDWSPDGQRLLLIRREIGSPLEESTSELFEFHLTDALAARKQEGTDSFRGSEWTAKTADDYLEKVQHDLAGLIIEEARYAPDGKTLAVVAYDPENQFAPNLVADDVFGRMNMMRLLGKIATVDVSDGTSKIIADYDDGIRGPICWSSDGTKILFSRYLPKDDNREKFREDKEHGLAIWSIDRDGKNAEFITTGWSPDCGRMAETGTE